VDSHEGTGTYSAEVLGPLNVSADGDVDGGRMRDAVSRAFVGSDMAIGTSGLSIVDVDAGELLCDVGASATTAWVVVSG